MRGEGRGGAWGWRDEGPLRLLAGRDASPPQTAWGVSPLREGGATARTTTATERPPPPGRGASPDPLADFPPKGRGMAQDRGRGSGRGRSARGLHPSVPMRPRAPPPSSVFYCQGSGGRAFSRLGGSRRGMPSGSSLGGVGWRRRCRRGGLFAGSNPQALTLWPPVAQSREAPSRIL